MSAAPATDLKPDSAPADVDAAGPSAALGWRPLSGFIETERRLAARAVAHGPLAAAVYELVRFGIKQAWACLFGVVMLALLIVTHFAYPHDAILPRYDALVLAAVAVQAAMLIFGLETAEEAKVILVFHLAGTVMEIFKTHVGSWVYPEASYLRLAGVPLFTGFMYASVGSYIARCWRLFDFRFTGHPSPAALTGLSLAIYVNFFSHHFICDARLALFLAAALLFGRTTLYFRVWHVHREMPLLTGFGLVAVFIWFAENIGTFTSAWVYPSQRSAWHVVPLEKLGSWFLLMLISYALVVRAGSTAQPAVRRTSLRPLAQPAFAARLVPAPE